MWDEDAYAAAVRSQQGLPPVPAYALERIRPLIGPALQPADDTPPALSEAA